MTNITYQEYWSDIREGAASIAKEAWESASDEDEARDRANELAHEVADGHHWVIYTAYNPQVLTHSDNESAAFEYGGVESAESYGQAMHTMAFWALLTDLQDALSSALEEYAPDCDD